MKLIVPNSLDEITLQQYQDYNQELEAYKDNSEYLKIKKIEIFCNLTREQVLSFDFSSVEKVSNLLDTLLELQPMLMQKFTVNNIRFGWLPKLDDMSYGELLDLNANISDWNNMHVAMGVLYRPIKKEVQDLYSVEEYKGDKYHNDLKQMPLSAVIGSMVFFWNLGLDCLNYIIRHLEENQTEFKQQLNLTTTGIGIQQLTNSLGATLQNMKLLNK